MVSLSIENTIENLRISYEGGAYHLDYAYIYKYNHIKTLISYFLLYFVYPLYGYFIHFFLVSSVSFTETFILVYVTSFTAYVL